MHNTHACPSCGHRIPTPVFIDNTKHRKNAAMMLAQHLTFSLQIREGKELIMIHGTTGRERNNLEAVTAWVSTKMEHIQSWPMPANEAVELIEKLEHELKSTLQNITREPY